MSTAAKPPTFSDVLPTPGHSCSSSSTSVGEECTNMNLEDESLSLADVTANLPASLDPSMLRWIGSSTSRRRDILTYLATTRQSPTVHSQIAVILSEAYSAVIRHKSQHDAFLTCIRSLTCETFDEVALSITSVIRSCWPGAKPTAGAGSWLTNLASLLGAVATEVRAAASSSQRAADSFARYSPLIVEAVVEKFADDIDSKTPIVSMLATRAYANCLAQLLRLAALVDAASLQEATTARLNGCFASFTDVLEAVVVDPIGVEVVIAMVDDLARGLKARRHVMDNFVTYSLHPFAKHAVIAVFEHSGKVSKAVGTALLHAAPSTLIDVALTNADGIVESTPTIIALACHPEGSSVVVAVLPHLDGYYAVAIADSLHQWSAVLSTCAVPEVSVISAWAATHPGFEAAVIGVHGKLTRDLIINKRDIVPTSASKNIEACIATTAPLTPPPHKVSGKICFQFHTGECPQGVKCNMLHVAQEVVSQLSNRDCCWLHGEPSFREEHSGMLPFIDKPFAIIESSNHSRRFDLTGAQLSFTAGLAVYLARDYDVGLPIETESLCRQHQRCSCHKPQQCKYIHVCRQLFTLIQEAAPAPSVEATAVPLRHQMPSTPLLRNAEHRRPFETHVTTERRLGGSCASTASGELGRARQQSATGSVGFSDLSESPIALAMSRRRNTVDTTPGAPRVMLWKLGPGHGTPSVNSTTDVSAHTGGGSLL